MSSNNFNDGSTWNEFQWESHLDEIEKRSEQLRRFITSDPRGKTPRWIMLLRENLDEQDAVEAFIEEELLLDEAYFPEDEDDWEDDDEEMDEDDFFFKDSSHPFSDEEEDDFDYGEEWKELSDDFAMSEHGSIENLDIYTVSRELAVDILKWAEVLPKRSFSKHLDEFIINVLKVTAKLAGGYSFGFEQDVLGGNIAYTKKALYEANSALSHLRQLKTEPYLTEAAYSEFHARIFELRNDIGIYIQELRDRFRFGLE